MLSYYRDKIIIITGAASGIGLAMAEVLHSLPCDLILADRQEAILDIAERLGARAHGRVIDVRDSDQVKSLIEGTVSNFGRIDCLFNNAGIGTSGDAVEFSIEDWDDLIDVNLRGVVHGCHFALPIMRQQGFGHIINTASVAGIATTPGMAGYSATKHAVIGLTKALRIENLSSGIYLTALCPGAVETPIFTGGKYGRLVGYKEEGVRKITETWQPVTTTKFAGEVLRQVSKRKGRIVAPLKYRVLIAFMALLPWRLEERLSHLVHKQNRKILEPYKLPGPL